MPFDAEAMQAEIDVVLDAQEVEKETAAGVKGAEASEDTTLVSENVVTEEQTTETTGDSEDIKGQVVDTDNDVDTLGGFSSETIREEAEAKKVLGDEKPTEDSTVDTDETPVQFNDTTLARAVASGITLTEARSFPDNAALDRFVDSVESNLLPPSVPVEVQADKPDLFDGLPELNPDDYSPEVIQTLDRFKKVLIEQQEQIAASDARTDSVNESVRGAGEAEMVEWYDQAVKGLGDDYKDALGEGSFASLNGSGKHFVNRNDIAGKIAVMYNGHIAQGIQPPPREELFEMAVRMVLPNQQSSVERRKLAGELEEQATQHISRVSGVNGKSSRSPEEETAALLDETYR